MTLQSVIKMFTRVVYRTISVLWIMVKWCVCMHLPLLLIRWMLSITLLLGFWPVIFITLIIASCISKTLRDVIVIYLCLSTRPLLGGCYLISHLRCVSPGPHQTRSDDWIPQHVPWVCTEPYCFYRGISHDKISSFKLCKNTVLLAILFFYSYTRADSDCRVCVVKQLVCRMLYNMLTWLYSRVILGYNKRPFKNEELFFFFPFLSLSVSYCVLLGVLSATFSLSTASIWTPHFTVNLISSTHPSSHTHCLSVSPGVCLAGGGVRTQV